MRGPSLDTFMPFLYFSSNCIISKISWFCLLRARSLLSSVKSRYKTILPPPFFWHRYGKRQTFPRPTAKPIVAKRNSSLFPQDSRCSVRSMISRATDFSVAGVELFPTVNTLGTDSSSSCPSLTIPFACALIARVFRLVSSKGTTCCTALLLWWLCTRVSVYSWSNTSYKIDKIQRFVWVMKYEAGN